MIFDYDTPAFEGYDSYVSCTMNGIVRMCRNTPASINGLSTFRLRTCVCLVLYNMEGKSSLSHIVCFHTDVDRLIKEELSWMGGPVGVSAVLLRNAKFLATEPDELSKVSGQCEKICALLSYNGIEANNVHLQAANGGAVCFNGRTREFSCPETENIEATVGRTCPYWIFRDKLQSLFICFLEAESSLAVDLQFDGADWTRVPTLSTWKIPFSLDTLRRYNDMDEATAIRSLLAEPALQQLPEVRVPRGEFGRYAASVARHLRGFCDLYDKYYYFPSYYKMYQMTSAQHRAIEAIDGIVLETMDYSASGPFWMFRAPSRYLKREVRDVLQIDRIRYSKTMDPAIKAKISSALQGWRAEPDYEKRGHTLITYPYRDEAHKLLLKERLKRALL